MEQDLNDRLLHRAALLAEERMIDPDQVDALERLQSAFQADKLRKARKIGAKILRKINPEQMPLVHARTQLVYGYALLYGKGDPETALEHIDEGVAALEQDDFRDCHLEELAHARHTLAMYYSTLATAASEADVDLWIAAYEHGRAALGYAEQVEAGSADLSLVIVVVQAAFVVALQVEIPVRTELLQEVVDLGGLALQHVDPDDDELREFLQLMVTQADQRLQSLVADTGDAQWDLFVSHASEDKIELVAPLTNALDAFGVRVWYDEFQIEVGESLEKSIDEGLARSKYGLVILSPSFFNKAWTAYELDALVRREGESEGVLMSVWHDITYEEIAAVNGVAANLPHVEAASFQRRAVGRGHHPANPAGYHAAHQAADDVVQVQ